LIWLKISLIFPWSYGVVHGHILRASSCTNEWKVGPRIIFGFNVDATSSWWRPRTERGARSSWSQSPSSLVLCISPNFRTLVILLQIDPAFGDEPKTVYEGCYKIEDTSIFAWSSIPSVGHYRWLRGLIRRLPPNSKADYLARTIRHILNFLQLWTIIAA
jgi:hypothetical protein